MFEIELQNPSQQSSRDNQNELDRDWKVTPLAHQWLDDEIMNQKQEQASPGDSYGYKVDA